MRRGLERRLRALEARRRARGSAPALLENFEAELALLPHAELVQRILALQANPDAHKRFATAYQFFDEALVNTLTDEEITWVVAELQARNTESAASRTARGRARKQTHKKTVGPVVGCPRSIGRT